MSLRYLTILVVVGLCACSAEPSRSGASLPTPPIASSGAPKGSVPNSPVSPVSQKPSLAWGSLGLAGKVIYPTADVTGTSVVISVQSLDLSNGDVTVVFQPPTDGWVDAAMASPDGKELMLSYQPPVGAEFGGQGALYLQPLDGSTPPTLLFAPGSRSDRYYQPVWAPDARFVYFTHATYGSTIENEIMRMAYPDGTVEKVVDHALWPSISVDGKRLVFVSSDPATAQDRLFTANVDGSQPAEVTLSGPQPKGIIDAPIFLPGDQSILFSAPPPERAGDPPSKPPFGQSWVDQLLGITVASAHAAVVTELWSVPVTGGTPAQLTHLHALALFAGLSPDGQSIASYSSNAVYVMRLDGTKLTSLAAWLADIPGTVSWVP